MLVIFVFHRILQYNKEDFYSAKILSKPSSAAHQYKSDRQAFLMTHLHELPLAVANMRLALHLISSQFNIL